MQGCLTSSDHRISDRMRRGSQAGFARQSSPSSSHNEAGPAAVMLSVEVYERPNTNGKSFGYSHG